MKPTTKQIRALQKFLNDNKYDADDLSKMIEDGEYLVLRNSEANKKAKDYILETAWSFNKSFLNCHSKAIAEIDDKAWASFQEGCDSINSAVLAMIDDKDYFIEDAIKADGRGHFLSPYNGEENCITVVGDEYYIYRVD